MCFSLTLCEFAALLCCEFCMKKYPLNLYFKETLNLFAIQAIHGKSKPYMCLDCKQFFKTKQELVSHGLNCTEKKTASSIEEIINERVKYTQVDPPMSIEKMRLLVTILLKKISNEKRLKELGYEKRLIDNVLLDSLKCAERTVCTDPDLTEAERLKNNVNEFLQWTIPSAVMQKFKEERKSVEEILEKLVGGFLH